MKKGRGGENDIRKLAEAKFAVSGEHVSELSDDDARELIRELHIHQMELEMQNEEQRKAIDMLSKLYDFAPVGYVTLNDKGIILQANHTLAGMLGMDTHKLVKVALSFFVVSEDQDKYSLHIKAAFAAGNKHKSSEIRLRKSNNSIFWAAIETTVEQVTETSGKNLMMVITDMTGKKEHAHTVRSEKEKSQRYLDVVGSMLIALDEQGRITLFNQSACRILGWSEKEILGKDWFDLFVPEYLREGVRDVFNQLAAGNVALVEYYENVILTKAGEERIVAFHNAVILDDSDHFMGTLSSGEDVTERRQAEEKLKEDEQRFRALFQSAADYALVLDIQESGPPIIIDANDAAFEKHGYSREEMVGQPITLLDVKSSADQIGVRLSLIKQEPTVIHFEVEHRCKDGSTFVAAVAAKSIESSGDQHLFFSIERDITKQKQAKEDLESAEAHAVGIIENARDAFVGMDEQGIVIDWNPEAVRMFGFTKKEAMGRNLADTIIPTEFREVHTAGLKHYMETGEHKMINRLMEISALHKNGNRLDVELSIVPLKDDHSVTFNAFIRDLTERNTGREELVKSAENLRKSLVGTVLAIAKAVEARDPYTAGHQQRVSQLARSIAQEMRLDKDMIEGIRMGAVIHDIGKIHLPAEILSKPGKLTDIEYTLVQEHAQTGYEILEDIEFPWPVADIAHQHHERMDGSGYPQGLKGDKICLEARVVAVADVIEAISSHRPYREALGIDAALNEIKQGRGTLFDAEVVDACLKLFAENRFAFKR